MFNKVAIEIQSPLVAIIFYSLLLFIVYKAVKPYFKNKTQ